MRSSACARNADGDAAARVWRLFSNEFQKGVLLFSRFNATARRVMQRAFREAKRCQHDFVGTEHLLYGLCCDPEGPATTLLRTLGARPELVLQKVEISLQRHDGGMAMEQFPLSPASKRVFRAAADEAASFNHQMIGPEHLLLGLLRDRECEAAQVLAGHGVTLPAVREAVARIPPDTYHDAQIRTPEQARTVPGDNPSVDELEDWIAPPITIEQTTAEAQPSLPNTTAPAPVLPRDVVAQLRRTQLFLGAFGGYIVGHLFRECGTWGYSSGFWASPLPLPIARLSASRRASPWR